MKNSPFKWKKTIVGILLIGVFGCSGSVFAENLTSKTFSAHWQIEAAPGSYQKRFYTDTLEITASKGLTLWYKEKMQGDVLIEFDACILDQGQPNDRLSDLNCFWMAMDPEASTLWKRAKWRNGEFEKCYSLQMYYMGYGGNHNTTTRFRAYDGDYASFLSSGKTPAILKEYTDSLHLLQPNQWMHIKIKVANGRVEYYRDGERLVDYRDPNPLTEGWFGFRTTQARARITNFRWQKLDSEEVDLRWIGNTPDVATPVSLGVPFRQGNYFDKSRFVLYDTEHRIVPTDTWPLAYWPDGSVKWLGIAGVMPAHCDQFVLKPEKNTPDYSTGISISQDSNGQITVHNGKWTAYFSAHGENLWDSLCSETSKIADAIRLVGWTEQTREANSVSKVNYYTSYTSKVKQVIVERAGNIRTVIRIEGVHANEFREWLPFTVRLYFYAGSDQVKMVHTFVYDGDQDRDFVKGLGIRLHIPLRESLYNRHVFFAGEGKGSWSEPVQPLTGRRVLQRDGEDTWYRQQIQGKRIPAYDTFDEKGRNLIDNWASWDGYRLSQLTPEGFTIRKQATQESPWIGTASSSRSRGFAFAGDVSGGVGLSLRDFWQSYPASIEIQGMKTDHAGMTVWLWSPEHEAMNLRHYDTEGHDLNASYEDIQEGMSTPFGIARTSILTLHFSDTLPSRSELNARADRSIASNQLICSPGYLQRNHAFGRWSLPDRSTPARAQIEDFIDSMTVYYERSVEQRRWYGFWNYGDFMHTYDPVRHEWRYDIGGYAWDNTELASNMFLWYTFLRTGKESIWRMAEAMTRHTAEVDVYHLGPMAGLGTRHNVSHWGCGAKEARISQAAWNRFYYYLTTDERCGDLMTEVKDADQLLYTIDPMRLAQPRSQYPCSAPARLRIGPDWLAYSANWMTEWERTRNLFYRDKIVAGMQSIGQLPKGIFTGPTTLGYDPATGIISYEGDTAVQSTNHLMTIMGGFETNLEMMEMIHQPDWERAWLDHAARYSKMGGAHFRVPKLTAYAAYKTGNRDLAIQAWKELFYGSGVPRPVLEMNRVEPPYVLEPVHEAAISTNDAATWALNAIYMMEVIPVDDYLSIEEMNDLHGRVAR